MVTARYPRLTFAFSFIVLLLFALGIPKLKILVSMNELVDQSLESAKSFQQLKDNFRLKNNTTLLFKPKNHVWSHESWHEYESWRKKFNSTYTYAQTVFTPLDIRIPVVDSESIDFKSIVNIGDKNFRPILSTPWGGILTDANAETLSLQIQLRDAAEPRKFGNFSPDSMKKLILSVQDHGFRLLDVIITGPAAFTHYAVEGVSFGMKLNFLFLLLLVLLFKHLFGTWRSGLFLVVTFLWSGLILHGAMAHFGFPLEILSSGLFTMIIIASIEDYYFLCHENAKGVELDECFSRLIAPSFFTSFTTIVGFGSLAFSDIDIIKRFGFFAAIGALLEWIAVFYVLPSVIKVFRINTLHKPRHTNLKYWDSMSLKLNRLTPRRHLAYALLLCYIGGAIALQKIPISPSPVSLFPSSHRIVKDLKVLQSDFGWESDASVVFPNIVNEKRQREVLSAIKKQPNISKIETLFDVEDYISGGDKTGGLKQAFNVLYNQHPMYQRHHGKDSSTRHIVYLKKTDFNDLVKSINDIKSVCKNECTLIGEIISYAEFMEKIPVALIKSLGSSVFFVALILYCLAKWLGFSKPLMFTVGSLWGPSILLILMYIFNLKLSFLTCIFVCMMVGLAGDNGIQFLFAEKREGAGKGIDYFQSCSLQMGVIMAASCLIFMLSYFSPPREFGPILCAGFLFSLFGDIWLTKALTRV